MEVIRKDITTVEEGIICQVVNNKGVMGAGVAKAIYTTWPEVRTQYLDLKTYKLGTVDMVEIKPPSKLEIANLIAQDGYGRDGKLYLKYGPLSECLEFVARFNKMWYDVPIYIPYGMGCGLAGGDWDTVLAILKEFVPNAILCKK